MITTSLNYPSGSFIDSLLLLASNSVSITCYYILVHPASATQSAFMPSLAISCFISAAGRTQEECSAIITVALVLQA
jgi:hypothetical protein